MPEGFWYCWIDGELWSMFEQYRVERQITTVEQLDLLLGKDPL
jgi:hypothetical protein